MTIQSRSLSHENLYISETPQDNLSLENGEYSLPVKKIKQASTDIFQEKNSEAKTSKSRDYALMNDPDVLVTKIRHITTERWIQAIYDEPNNGVLVFNYGRMYPLLTRDHAKGRGLNHRECITDLLNDIDFSHRYVCMNQEELFKEAAKRDFQGKCIYKQLAKVYQFIDYTVLENRTAIGEYQGKLSVIQEVDNFLKLIELYSNDDMNYALLGKTIRYYSMLNKQLEYPQEEDWIEEKILSLPGIKQEEDLYHKALLLNPHNDEAYVGLGLINVARDEFKETNLFFKAFQLNPKNLEAAVLHLNEIDKFLHPRNHQTNRTQDEIIKFPADNGIAMCKAIENTIQSAPHYLATAPHWYEWGNLSSIDESKNYFSVILKKFINSSLEKHVKRHALKSFINAQDHIFYSENEEQIANLLFFLSKTHLVSPKEDFWDIKYFCEENFGFHLKSIHIVSIWTEFLKAHFPHDETSLKKLISHFMATINESGTHSEMAYYYLATLISSDETLEIRGEKLTQLELYQRAASYVYNTSFYPHDKYYTLDRAAHILGHYAQILEEDEKKEDLGQYNFEPFEWESASSMTKKNIYLKALSIGHESAWPYFYLGKAFQNPIEIRGKRFSSSKELFLTALDVGPYHAEAYYHLGNLLSQEESITLLNGTTLTRQQLYTKAIQLGVDEAHAYYQAANMMKEGQAILLFNGVTYLSKIDLLFKAFSMKMESCYYLNQIALHFKKQKSLTSVT